MGHAVTDERGLYERISLEAFQAGLAWATILRKRPAFREAFDDFDPDRVAAYGPADVERLLGDARIVRNRMKIETAITNARATIALRAEVGLVELVWSFKPPATPQPAVLADIPTSSKESAALSRELRRRGFAFVGPTTMFALRRAATGCLVVGRSCTDVDAVPHRTIHVRTDTAQTFGYLLERAAQRALFLIGEQVFANECLGVKIFDADLGAELLAQLFRCVARHVAKPA
jgi:DNA-3-methyladenine glycosylase I